MKDREGNESKGGKREKRKKGVKGRDGNGTKGGKGVTARVGMLHTLVKTITFTKNHNG